MDLQVGSLVYKEYTQHIRQHLSIKNTPSTSFNTCYQARKHVASPILSHVVTVASMNLFHFYTKLFSIEKHISKLDNSKSSSYTSLRHIIRVSCDMKRYKVVSQTNWLVYKSGIASASVVSRHIPCIVYMHTRNLYPNWRTSYWKSICQLYDSKYEMNIESPWLRRESVYKLEQWELEMHV